MEHKPYFPTNIAGQRLWLVNYKGLILVHGAALGLTPLQITALQNACQAMIDKIDEADAALTAGVAKVAERDNTVKTQMAVLRPAIVSMKKNSGYSTTIGEALDIIGSEIIVDTLTVKTKIKLAAVPTGVDIKFGLEYCEGGNIYSKRGNETAFTYFKHVTHPHSIDTRPNLAGNAAEQRQYYVVLVINDLEVGIASAPETINI